MVWFQVDDTLAFHPKAIEAGNAALGLWVRAGSWSAQTLSDGYVPRQIARSLGTVGQCKALVVAGLWREVDGGYRFHQWDEKQQTKEEVESRRKAERDRKSEQRKRSRVPVGQPPDVRPDNPRDSHRDSTRESQPESAADSTQVSGSPIPSLPFNGGSVGGSSYVSNARENDPPPRSCSKHPELDHRCADCAATARAREAWLSDLLAATEPPRHCPTHHDGTDDPCRACKAAREFHEQWQRDRQAAAQERQRAAAAAQSAEARAAAQLRAEAIAACDMCDTEGRIDGWVCSHDPDRMPKPGRGAAAVQLARCRLCDADGLRADSSLCDHRPVGTGHASRSSPPRADEPSSPPQSTSQDRLQETEIHA